MNDEKFFESIFGVGYKTAVVLTILNFLDQNRTLSKCVPHSEFFLSYPFITNSNRVCGTSKCHSHFATFFYVFGGHKLFYLMTAHYFSGAKKMVIWGGQTKI